MAETRKIHCTCVSEYQDKRYGPGVRLANVRKDNSACCTVCAKIPNAFLKKK